MKVYAFDVDDTLDFAGGPIKLRDLIDLSVNGEYIGICGNWKHAAQKINLVMFSFIGPARLGQSNNSTGSTYIEEKAKFLALVRSGIEADDYIMVGNVPMDSDAAELAKWRFIKEKDFAERFR